MKLKRNDLNDRSTTDEIWSGWTWTTNPIGFSERFTIRTDSHQHTNTNIGLHARTDREFLHSTSYGGNDGPPPADDERQCILSNRAGARPRKPSMPGSRARRTSAGTSNYRARGVIHTGRDAQGQAAPRRRHNHKPKTPHQKGHEWTVLGRCRAPLVLVSLSSPAAAPPIQNGCHTSARPR